MLTSLNWLRQGEVFPPQSEAKRLEVYQDNLNLYLGEHEKVFPALREFLLSEQYKNYYSIERAIIFNFYSRLSKLWASLLLNEPPTIKSKDANKKTDKYISGLTIRTQFQSILSQAVIDDSRYGVGILRLRLKDGLSIIEIQQPKYWFPIAHPDNMNDILYHALAWTFDVQSSPKTVERYLKVEVHSKGFIDHMLFQLNPNSNAIIQRVPLKMFSRYEGLLDRETTNVDDFLVIPIMSDKTSDSYFGKDDYTELDSLIQEIEMRLISNSIILDKHADPKLVGPDSLLSDNNIYGTQAFNFRDDFIALNPNDVEPKYLVWQGNIKESLDMIEKLMDLVYLISETSQAVFGKLDVGLISSGSALRRVLQAPLAKASRIKNMYTFAIEKAIKLASQLETSNGNRNSVLVEEVDIIWHDGLPNDETELIQNQVAALNGRIKSLDRILAEQGLFGEDAEKEKYLINESLNNDEDSDYVDNTGKQE